MLRNLVDLVAPPACAVCGASGRAGALLCGECRAGLAWLGDDTCERCALPQPCAPCPAASAAFDRAWAAVAYAGGGRATVAALKFRGRMALADLMAAQIAANAPPDTLAGTLVPIPTVPTRRRARGFDQAELLTTALARRTGLPTKPLLRRLDRARQAGAGRAKRLAAPLAVHVRGSAPTLVTLVDDVHTTGATLHRCAQALRAAGATRVHAVTYARTLRSNIR